METRTVNKKYAEIGQRLIETRPEFAAIRESGADIIFLESDAVKKSRGKIVLGDCEKVPDKWKWAVPADFIITIYSRSAETLNDQQMEVLIMHELLHVGIAEDMSFTGYHFFVAPHDIEDFKRIIEEYGIEWDKFH